MIRFEHENCDQSTSFKFLSTNSTLSIAEQYINMRSQMVTNEHNDHILNASLTTRRNSFPTHNERMHQWREKQVNDLNRIKPYRYKYGVSGSSSKTSTYRIINNQTDAHSVRIPNLTTFLDRKKKKIM